jgi:hypothetical protein
MTAEAIGAVIGMVDNYKHLPKEEYEPRLQIPLAPL